MGNKQKKSVNPTQTLLILWGSCLVVKAHMLAVLLIHTPTFPITERLAIWPQSCHSIPTQNPGAIITLAGDHMVKSHHLGAYIDWRGTRNQERVYCIHRCPCFFAYTRVPTETGKPGKRKWSWKSHRTWKIGEKKWNFVISHGILVILPSDVVKFVFSLLTLRNSVLV